MCLCTPNKGVYCTCWRIGIFLSLWYSSFGFLCYSILNAKLATIRLGIANVYSYSCAWSAWGLQLDMDAITSHCKTGLRCWSGPTQDSIKALSTSYLIDRVWRYSEYASVRWVVLFYCWCGLPHEENSLWLVFKRVCKESLKDCKPMYNCGWCA